jgi:hypothetical protein
MKKSKYAKIANGMRKAKGETVTLVRSDPIGICGLEANVWIALKTTSVA